MTIDLAAIKAALSDIPGIESLTETIIGGRRVYGLNGLVAAVDINSAAAAVETAIRNAVAMRVQGLTAAITPAPVQTAAPNAAPAGANPITPLPSVVLTPAPTQVKPMSTPAPGSFAASIRAMMYGARADLEKAKADGLAQVGEAIGKLSEAKAATTKVASQMASTIHDEAAAVLSELGQISNDIG